MAKTYDPSQALPDAVKRSASKLEETDPIPAGYIPVELTTKGLLGAPAIFHVRNFDTTDLMNLALAEDDDLPKKVAKMLDNLIWEEGVSVADFHEKEVIELLVRLYQAYYTDVLKDVDFPWNKDDLEYLQKKYGGAETEEYQRAVADLKYGRWVPKTDIVLSEAELYDIDPSVKKEIFITTKDGFEVGFSFPRYGDVLVLKDFMDKEWKERDKQFASLRDTLKFRRDAEDRLRQGEDIVLSRIPNIPESERQKYKEYEEEKAVFGVYAVKALHLIYYQGIDLRKMSLKDRMEYTADPRLDYTLLKKVTDYFSSLKIGLHNSIKMRNPLKEVVELREYSFRLVDILQAVKLFEPDDYTISFEPTHVE